MLRKGKGRILVQFFFAAITLALFILLPACSATQVPQVGAGVPCQIHAVAQVEHAVHTGLIARHWQILSFSAHSMQARKTQGQRQATIDVAYGYRGFSIEYADSQHMDYDAGHDTITATYVTWVYDLMDEIKQALQQEVKRNPAIKCYGRDTPH